MQLNLGILVCRYFFSVIIEHSVLSCKGSKKVFKCNVRCISTKIAGARVEGDVIKKIQNAKIFCHKAIDCVKLLTCPWTFRFLYDFICVTVIMS